MEKNFGDALPYDIYSDTNPFFLLPGEHVVLTTRQHIYAILPPIIIACLLGIGAILLGFTGASFINPPAILTLLCGSIIVVMTLSLVTKLLVDWYFHIYLVTNRRILEIVYRPFFSQDVNDVLLDQVRCTEIDIQIRGYVHGLIDVGDIIITFDRPTHQQEFVLHDIKSPRKNGTLLGHLLNTPKAAINSKTFWHQVPTSQDNNYTFSEEITPTPMRSKSTQRIQIV